jgi:outer membrane protein assembly factor BamB
MVFVPTDGGVAAYPVADCGRLTAGGACRSVWSRTLGAAIVAPPVALDNGDLAVPMAEGRIVVLDAATGEPEWTGNAGAALSVSLAATGTTIFAAAGNRVAAFPAGGCGGATCEPAWTATTSGPASAAPSVGGNVLYVGDGAGGLTALPAAGCGAPTCDALWTGSVAEGVIGPPVISDGTLYVPGAALGETGPVGSITAFRVSTGGPTSR